MEKFLPTGNQQISLPRIREHDGGIEDFTFLHMGSKGLIDVRGDKEKPLMQPFFMAGGKELTLSGLQWERLSHWVPAFTCRTGGLVLRGVFLAPVDERGFLVRLEVFNESGAPAELSYGLRGRWSCAWHCVNEDKELTGERYAYHSNWNDSVVFDMRCGAPMFAFAPMADRKCQTEFSMEKGIADYQITRTEVLAPGGEAALTIYWGLGFEEVAAATSAKEMLRQGYSYELNRTLAWLNARTLQFADSRLTALYNTNLFFCIFFSTGVTLDTEELTLMTSRSPRYYVSAAYWDRDSLLWSFPAVLDADPVLAREMLLYVYGRQRRNLGVHSRYIDGTVLEPGFELDELMAPVLALERYVDAAGDRSILEEPGVQKGVGEILQKLQNRRHSEISLYSTFLQPTDDEIVHPYLTYDNVLVWKAFNGLANLWPERSSLRDQAEKVKQAIGEHCVKEKDGKAYYAWSVDLEGRHDVYDEPPGSLQLLPFLGFCEAEDEIYQNTVAMIRSPEYAYSFAGCEFAEIGCPHAPHPWILSVANSLLCGRYESSAKFLLKVKMDHLIACESVDEHTGQCTTGEAFATCAGFLCHAMRMAKKGLDEVCATM